MTDKKWDDKKIEELLDNIPDAPDKRSKSDILARLKQEQHTKVRNTPLRCAWVRSTATFISTCATRRGPS